MESNFSNSQKPASDDPRNLLRELSADRSALASRASTPRWYYPVLGIAGAALVASPAVVGQSFIYNVLVFGSLAISLILIFAYQAKTGISITKPTGGKTTTTLAAIMVILVALCITAHIFVSSGIAIWVIALAAAAYVLFLFGGLVYDRVFAREIRENV